MVEKYPDKIINLCRFYIHANDNEIDWKEMNNYKALCKENFVLGLSYIDELEEAKNYGIKCYYLEPVTTFRDLRALKNLGVEWALIDAPLFFQMDKVKACGVPLRATANMAVRKLLPHEDGVPGPWIRPEDVPFYKKIGIEHIKITERDFPTEILVKRVEAYSNHSYNGNLLDLIQGHGYILEGTELEPLEVKTEFANINEVVNEIFKVRGFKLERKYPQHVYIDNKKLDGFLEFFKQGKCKGNCQNCNYCASISKKTITTNEEVSNYLKDLYGKFEDMLY